MSMSLSNTNLYLYRHNSQSLRFFSYSQFSEAISYKARHATPCSGSNLQCFKHKFQKVSNTSAKCFHFFPSRPCTYIDIHLFESLSKFFITAPIPANMIKVILQIPFIQIFGFFYFVSRTHQQDNLLARNICIYHTES